MRIAFKELVRQPGRFAPVGGALTLLVVLLVVLGGFLDGLELSQTGPYRAHEGRYLVFSDDSELLAQRSTIDRSVQEQIAELDGVKAVGGINTIATTAGNSEGQLLDVVLFGYELATDIIPNPPTNDGAVIDGALAERQGLSVGDTLAIGPSSQEVTVTAIVDDLTQAEPTVWVSLERWRQIVEASNPASLPPVGQRQLLAIEPADGSSSDSEATVLGAVDIGSIDGVELATPTQAIDALPVVQQQSSTFEGIIGVTFVVTLLVVALFFALITLERVDLYAVLKALGARTFDLVAGLSIQAVGVSIVAIILGFVLSGIFASLLPAELPVRIEPARLVQTAAGVLVTAVSGSLFTLRRILRIDPAEAIG